MYDRKNCISRRLYGSSAVRVFFDGGNVMGTYSWRFCDRPHKSLRIGEKGFLLLPDNSCLRENNYGGYGKFAGIDSYEMAALINREYMSSHPEYLVWQAHLIEVTDGNGGTKRKRAPAVRISDFPWYPLYADLNVTPEQFNELVKDMDYRGFPMCFRHIGVEIACYNEQNSRLPFPIKVASKPTLYHAWPASKDDPYQGY